MRQAGPAAAPQNAQSRDPRPQSYHRWACALGVLLFAVLIALVAMNHGTMRVAGDRDDLGRPAGGPADAVFCAGRDGGRWVRLKEADLRLADGGALPAFNIGAWHGLTGDPVLAGTGISCPTRR